MRAQLARAIRDEKERALGRRLSPQELRWIVGYVLDGRAGVSAVPDHPHDAVGELVWQLEVERGALP